MSVDRQLAVQCITRGTAGLLCVFALPWTTSAQVSRYRVYQDDGSVLSRHRSGWLDPSRVRRLEISGAGEDLLEAWAARRAWPLVRDPHKPVQTLMVTEELRRIWTEHGRLTIGYPTQRNSGGELVLRAPLRTLDLDGPAHVTLLQRRRAELPGSAGYLELRIGDITAGQVLVEVRAADGSRPVEQISLSERDHVDIALGGDTYVLRLDKLVNVLIGDDYAEFSLVARERFFLDQVDDLLAVVARSDVTFVREGEEWGGRAAAAHLRRKLHRVESVGMTVERFIEEIASRSSETGAPYRIICADGASMLAAEWLRQEAAALEKARGK